MNGKKISGIAAAVYTVFKWGTGMDIKYFIGLLLILFGGVIAADAQTWYSVGQGLQGSGIPVVYSITTDTAHTIVYAAGSFGYAGTDSARFIASWNGNSWDSVGGGMNAPVQVTLLHNDTLYAGGDFTLAAGKTANMLADSMVPAEHIARWNGFRWDTVGRGMNGSVYALALFNGKLYAGGAFTTAGKVHANHVAVWDGRNWDSVGRGFNNAVYSLIPWRNELYAGGNFDSSAWTKVNYVAQWNGTVWAPLGSGMNSYVNALLPFNGLLYAAGNFDTAGGNPTGYIATWNGALWDTAGTGFNAEASVLDSNGGMLYAGGYFTGSGNTTVNGIARWNGTRWDSLSGGVGGGSVYAIASYKGGIFAGGNFIAAGRVAANSIALWDTSAALPVTELASKGAEVGIYPDPCNGRFQLEVREYKTGMTYEVEIYDVLCQRVSSLAITGGLTTIDLEAQPPGIYFYRLFGSQGNLMGSGKFIIAK